MCLCARITTFHFAHNRTFLCTVLKNRNLTLDFPLTFSLAVREFAIRGNSQEPNHRECRGSLFMQSTPLDQITN